jgi:PAS domain S-box-containing protein
MSRTPTIVLVDDAVEVRTLVRARLRLSGVLDVVGEGSSGHDAIALATRLRPDLLLLDVSMPGMDGLEALPVIRRSSPDTQVVMYSGFAEEGLADRTIELGAAAYFEKLTALDTLATDLTALLDAPDMAPKPVGVPESASSESAEPVLREHLERFREVFDDATIGMATMTLSGRVVRANRSLARLTGIPVSDLLAASWAVVGGDDAQLVGALAEVAAGDRDAVQVEHAVQGLSNRRLLTTVSSVRDAHERPLYLFLQVQDVSAQREAEAELRLVEERFRLLVETVQDYAIFMLDPDGHIASWNKGAQRIKGWSEAEIVGQHFRVFYPEDQQLSGHPERELELALRDGHYEEEGWRVRKDGTTFWAAVTITAVHDKDGLVGFAKVTRDITERLRSQNEREQAASVLATVNAELEAANAQLQSAADEQAHFFAVTAHELRSPVGVLGGTAHLLHQHWSEMQSHEQTELLEGMATSATRLRRLLDDLLASARIDAGATPVDLRPVALRPLLVQLARTSARTLDADIVVADGPDLQVLGDEDRIVQMVENLLTNASRHGRPPIVVALRPDRGNDAPMVQIRVSDTGGGVPEHLQDRLFHRFATSAEDGTGLGLFIVRGLARAQGGDAWYDADTAAFVVSLPWSAPLAAVQAG